MQTGQSEHHGMVGIAASAYGKAADSKRGRHKKYDVKIIFVTLSEKAVDAR
mgnify:CR=1 FL=1|tara:strand:- start:265 stop:417 length:153 start_codon:yes stop_codon:yes gene_type:complete